MQGFLFLEELGHYQEVIKTNYPALDGSCCVMDRLKIEIPKNW
jgi:hypothetical protein